ncbi:MAG: efflux RND transporter periplasmic adaptor subunit [Fibrobacter sp.]|nr:efflux RND transporter periplasmic adaptor subunit [Fibrobacter sp.]
MNNRIVFICFAMATVACAAGFDGVTEPIDQAKIGFTVSGKIDSIWVKEGAFVHKGDTIMNLVKTEEELRVSITKIEIEDTSSMASSQAKTQNYEKDLTATKKLYEISNSVSAAQVWEKEMNYHVAKAEWDAAKTTKAKDSLEYRMAQAQLQKQYLIAPFDGEIVSIAKHTSESVEALEPIVEIADVRQCRMIAYIIVNKASKLKVGKQVNLVLNNGSSVHKKGKIEFISPVVDKASLLRTVKVIFDNSDKSVEPGVTGKIILK